MTKKEITKSLSSASAAARIAEISKATDKILAQTFEISAPKSLDQTMEPIMESLSSLCSEASTALAAVSKAVTDLPETYTVYIAEVSKKAEKSMTSLLKVTLEIQQQATKVVAYALKVDKYQRRNIWLAALISAIIGSIPPVICCMAIAKATGNSPMHLLWSLWAT
jgi:division protein CdvB (Snf7/Vps24/ESCRT-III family)